MKNKALSICDHIISNNIDIMTLTETWLGTDVDNIVLCDLIPDGYDFYHVPRQHQRGGRVALIYNKSLSLNTMIIINDFMISSLP